MFVTMYLYLPQKVKLIQLVKNIGSTWSNKNRSR